MIDSPTAKSVYIIQEGVTSYPIGFEYNYDPYGNPEIVLYKNNHPESPLAYGSDYTISGDGLSVVLLDNYEVGDRLVILRNIYMVQRSDYHIGRIDPEQIEHDFDEAVMRDQQLQAEMDLLEELPIDHERRIQAIEAVIPEEATPTNQLTDKAYVDTQISNHTDRTDNPHSVTATQVGLGNCDNTSDLDKPISTATQSALDLKANSADLATVATSGAYSDLSGTPSIPSVIDDLSDVTISSAQDGEFLMYDGVAGKWKNTASSATVGFSAITGSPRDNTALADEFDKYVNLTTAQTVAGDKTFSDSIKIKYGSSTANQGFIYNDSTDGLNIGLMNSDNSAEQSKIVFGASSGNITLTPSSTGIVSAPNTDKNNSVVITVDKTKSSNGYFKLGNGLIIQWGTIDTTGDSRAVIFPTAFSDTSSFSVTVNPKNASNSQIYTMSINNRTTTGFTLYSGGNVSNYGAFWIAVGY